MAVCRLSCSEGKQRGLAGVMELSVGLGNSSDSCNVLVSFPSVKSWRNP